MPTYSFECAGCKNVSEHYFDIDERPEHVACPDCSANALYSFYHDHLVPKSGHAVVRPLNHVSMSAAVHPSQVGEDMEFSKKTGTSCNGYTEWGEPKFSSTKQKERYLRVRGMNSRNSFT